MAPCHESALENVIAVLNATFRVIQHAKAGFCRNWTIEAMAAIQSMLDTEDYSISAQAREVHLEPGLSHTFIQVTIVCKGESELYILDGTGTAKFEPYAGLAANAPPHLKNSHIDPIQRYIDSI